jgi:hypothetical protein
MRKKMTMLEINAYIRMAVEEGNIFSVHNVLPRFYAFITLAAIFRAPVNAILASLLCLWC